MNSAELLANLKYFADSPPKQHGGFDDTVIATARGALELIAALEQKLDTERKQSLAAMDDMMLQRKELLQDKERLDWLDEQALHIGLTRFIEWGNKSLRQAIDEARKGMV